MPKMTMLIGEVVYCGNNVNNALVDHDLYTIITENVRDSYMLIDDSFTLVKFNKQFAHLFGFKTDKIVNRNLHDIFYDNNSHVVQTIKAFHEGTAKKKIVQADIHSITNELKNEDQESVYFKSNNNVCKMYMKLVKISKEDREINYHS